MFRFILILVFGFVAINGVYGSGWSDYQLDIGDGFSIVRCNGLDVCLCDKNHGMIYCPSQFVGTGPINGYALTENAVYLRTYGRKSRNLFAGDKFENVDPSREFFFIYDRKTEQLSPPLTAADFNTEVEPLSSSLISWIQPRNPNPDLPLRGAARFLGVIALYFLAPLTILIALSGVLLYAVRKRGRKR
ncbi:MAG: hypothetical protein JXB10_03935 [Pirellulales bacterium]|nr:hypothetical protein [Pirellulales bacterium]